MYKLAARSNCSFKIVQIARWLSDSIVPFFPLNVWGVPEKKCTFFQFLSTVHAKVANSNPINYIFLRSAINTLSIEHIKSPFFQNLKIGLECLPYVHCIDSISLVHLQTCRIIDSTEHRLSMSLIYIYYNRPLG